MDITFDERGRRFIQLPDYFCTLPDSFHTDEVCKRCGRPLIQHVELDERDYS